MGGFAGTIFSLLLGWVHGTAAWLWSAATSPTGSGLLNWLGANWLPLAIVVCAAGMIVDLVVYLFRWRPYRVWASFFRRMTGRRAEEERDEPAQSPPRKTVRRKWVYPDGTARTEEVEAPPERPVPVTAQQVYVPRTEARYPSGELPEQYMQRFARPAEPSANAAQPEQRRRRATRYQEEAQPEEARESASRGRWLNRETLQQLFVGEDDDELQLRYRPITPPPDRQNSYRAPYVPPQWRRPAEPGESALQQAEDKR